MNNWYIELRYDKPYVKSFEVKVKAGSLETATAKGIKAIKRHYIPKRTRIPNEVRMVIRNLGSVGKWVKEEDGVKRYHKQEETNVNQ